jgi:hypothetical protein
MRTAVFFTLVSVTGIPNLPLRNALTCLCQTVYAKVSASTVSMSPQCPRSSRTPTAAKFSNSVPTVREKNDSVIVCVERRIVKPEIVSLLSAANQQFNLNQRARICLGLIAQHGLLKATDLSRILNLSDETRIRSWLGSLLDKQLVLSRGRTRDTEYLINPQWLRLSQAKGQTTLKKIEPHRLRHLILEDLFSGRNNSLVSYGDPQPHRG